MKASTVIAIAWEKAGVADVVSGKEKIHLEGPFEDLDTFTKTSTKTIRQQND